MIFYKFTKPFQEFELLLVKHNGSCCWTRDLFFKTENKFYFKPIVDKIIPASIALVWTSQQKMPKNEKVAC